MRSRRCMRGPSAPQELPTFAGRDAFQARTTAWSAARSDDPDRRGMAVLVVHVVAVGVRHAEDLCVSRIEDRIAKTERKAGVVRARRQRHAPVEPLPKQSPRLAVELLA